MFSIKMKQCFLFVFINFLVVSFAMDVIDENIVNISENFTSVPYTENISSVYNHGKVIACFFNINAFDKGYDIETNIFDEVGNICTHLVYRTATLNNKTFDLEFKMYGERNKTLSTQVKTLKNKFPRLKIIIALGKNYESQSKLFNQIVQTSSRKEIFIQHAVNFIKKNALDGLHLHWQFPHKDEKEKYINLAKGLKKEFNGKYLLTSTMGGFKNTITKSYDVFRVTRIFDLVFLTSYGYNDDPLLANYASHMSPMNSTRKYLNTNDILRFLIMENNANPDTICLGSPFYGIIHPFKQPVKSKYGFGEPILQQEKKMGYSEICSQILSDNQSENRSDHWDIFWDEFAEVPFAKSDSHWLTFNNPDSIFARVRLATQFGLRGIMVSSINYDDFRGNCLKGNKNSLLRTVNYALQATKRKNAQLLCDYLNSEDFSTEKLFTPNDTIMSVPKKSFFQLHCMAEGNPLPQVTWYRKEKGIDMEVKAYKMGSLWKHGPYCYNFRQLNCSGRYQKTLSILKVKYFDPSERKAHYSCQITKKDKSIERAEFDVSVSLPDSLPDNAVSSWAWWLAGFFAVVVMFLLPIAIYVYLNRKYQSVLTHKDIQKFHRGDTIKTKSADNEINIQQQDPNTLPYNQDYEVRKIDYVIEHDKIIGSGEFGVVFRGKVLGQDAAVKSVKSDDRRSIVSLLSEVKIMIYLGNHLNVVNLLGAYTSELRKGTIFVFCEFCPYGDLLKYLRNIRSSFVSVLTDNNYSYNVTSLMQKAFTDTITEETFISWSIQIARGLEHLRVKKVIHGDLAARNILVFDKSVVKITDFGLSRKVYMYGNYQKSNNLEPLPWRWMSIESLRDLEFSCKSDIWSFAVTMWEIFTLGETPFSGMTWNLEFVQMLENNLRISKPKYATTSIYQLMTKCWNPNPEERPKPMDIQIFLGNILIKCFQQDDDIETEATLTLNSDVLQEEYTNVA